MQDITLWEKRFWLEWKLDPNTSKYNTPLVYKITGNLNLEALEKTLYEAQNKYVEIEKTKYVEHDKGISRGLLDHVGRNLEHINLQGATEEEISECIVNISSHVFDLSESPLCKFTLIRTGTKKFVLVLNHHHITSDAFGAYQLISVLSALYNHYASGTEKPPLPSSTFEGYCAHEKNVLSSGEYDRNINYWKNQLKDKKLYLDLPFKKHLKGKTPESDTIYFSLNVEETAQLKAMTKSCRTSPFLFLSAIFGLLLYRYTNEKEFAINYPLDMRPNGFKTLMGCFVNNLPLCFNISDDATVLDIVKELTLQRKEAKKYQFCSLADIISKLRNEKMLGMEQIFNVAFMETFLGTLPLDLKGVEVKAIAPEFNIIQGEMEVAYQLTNELQFRFNYRKDIFEPQLIQNFINHFKRILVECSKSVDTRVNNLKLFSTSEYNQLIYDWNCTEASYDKDKTIHQAFEEQVRTNPDNIAIVFENEALTYRELNEKANQLAHTIRNEYRDHWGLELTSDTLVGLYIAPSVEMIIAILAILKSGGAYVPFDTMEPENRLEFKIKNCETKMILTASNHIEDLLFLTGDDVLPLAIDSYWEEIEKAPKNNPKYINRSSDLAYVIYTSGSTGTPKGVMLEHSGVINLVNSHNKSFKLDVATKRILQFASISFDASVSTFFCSLLHGNTLYICNNNTRKDADLLLDYIIDNDINLIDIPPKILEAFDIEKISKSNKLETIIVAGETCDRKTMDTWKNQVNLINAYGPTESTVCVSFHHYTGELTTNIGKPIANKTFYVLDQNLHPVPAGVPGELYIGGDGLARGYLGRSDLTHKRFIPNFFASQEDRAKGRNLRIYKTGDLVRQLSDGSLEYIGRNDNQIKIRGFRVELGAIESKLSEYHGIGQAVVIAKQRPASNKTTQYLAAFYTGSKEIPVNKLRDYLSELLPEYMIPSVFVRMKEFPLNTSGKIDRKAFPEPELKYDKNNYVPPSTKLETLLCEVWQDMLGIPNPGIRSDFFKVGGDSIQSIQLVSRIRKMGYALSVKDIFDNRTIEKIAKACSEPKSIRKNNSKPYIEVNPDIEKPPLFIFPPAMLGPEAYLNNIVPILKSNNRLILFDNFYEKAIEKHGINSNKLPTFEQLAHEYIAIIKQIQPTGPYSLFGWSMGGAISLVIARELYKAGNKIKNLTICDTYFRIKDTISLLMQDKEDLYEKSMIYKYNLDNIDLNPDASINFLKATKMSESYEGIFPESQQMTKELLEYHKYIEGYYVEGTIDNKIGDILPQHDINIIPFNSSHYHWVSCEESIDKICSAIDSAV